MFLQKKDFTHHHPKKIVCLVPSITELLYNIGLDNEVVGITKFCIRPMEWFKKKERIGGTKKANLHKITLLQPDLVIANKEENTKDDVAYLANLFPLLLTDVKNYEDAIQMISDIGVLTEKATEAIIIKNNIITDFKNIITNKNSFKTCAYLIWNNPYLSIGGDTFIGSMLAHAGFINVFKKEKRYPEISIEKLQQLKPELVFLSSEPFPFKQKHVDELQKFLPGSKIILVDGEMFSWYGSRMLYAAAYFKNLQSNITAECF